MSTISTLIASIEVLEEDIKGNLEFLKHEKLQLKADHEVKGLLRNQGQIDVYESVLEKIKNIFENID